MGTEQLPMPLSRAQRIQQEPAATDATGRVHRRTFLKTMGTAAGSVLLSGCVLTGETSARTAKKSTIHWSAIPSPIIHEGTPTTAYRDPAALYHDEQFRLFFTHVTRADDGKYFWQVGETRSRDLINWTAPRLLTPRDQSLNYSSPGNVLRLKDRWVVCFQSFPTTPGNTVFANDEARIWTMESRDLEHWSDPSLLKVMGDDVPCEDMPHLIDPYLIRDKDDSSTLWCFYKYRRSEIGLSHTSDLEGLEGWTRAGTAGSAGENPSVLKDEDGYIMVYALPGNAIGFKRSEDLVHWQDLRVLTLGQDEWPWAQGRITAATILDLRATPPVGKYVMFFHGSSEAGKRQWASHGRASLGLAWSDDLVGWQWPGAQ
jgi:sucrose-6-phosphate hydrolase SacC (GH32 family)